MRQAAHRYLPDMVAEKKKLGFPVPIRIWLKEDAYYNRVKAAFDSPAAKAFFNTAEIIKYLDEHRAGKADNSRKIWTIYMLSLIHICWETKRVPNRIRSRNSLPTRKNPEFQSF